MTRNEALETLQKASALRERITRLSFKIEWESYKARRDEMILNKAALEIELNELKPARREAMKALESALPL